MSQNDLLEELSAAENPPTPPRSGFSLGSALLIGGMIVVALVVLLALLRQQQTQPTSGPAPDFTLTTYTGETFRLSDYRGRVVVINFWASWCGPCRDEAPILESLWQDYRDRGVVVLGVAYSDIDRDSLAFIQEFGVTYPNGADNGTFISDQLYHIIGVPETFIIDQQGNIRRFFYQMIADERATNADDDLFVTESSIRATIDQLLAEGGAPAS